MILEIRNFLGTMRTSLKIRKKHEKQFGLQPQTDYIVPDNFLTPSSFRLVSRIMPTSKESIN